MKAPLPPPTKKKKTNLWPIIIWRLYQSDTYDISNISEILLALHNWMAQGVSKINEDIIIIILYWLLILQV